MKQIEPMRRIRLGPADGIEAGARIRKRRLVAMGPPERAPACLLDSFDRRLAGEGRVLLHLAGTLVLLEPSGRILRAPASRPPRFLADLPEGALKAALSGFPHLRCLMEQAGVMATETRLALVGAGEKTEARLTRFDLAEMAGIDVAEPLRGYAGAFRALAARLSGEGATAAALLEALSGRPGYVAKPAQASAPDAPALEVATALVAGDLAMARQNEAGAAAGLDTEFLHDYRIALRRIRSVLSLFRGTWSGPETARLKLAFAALMARTGRLRDLDVFLLDRPRYLDMVPEPLRPGLEAMFAMLEKERGQAQAELARWFRSARYDRQMRALAEEFAAPGRLEAGPAADEAALPFANRLILARYRRIAKLARRIDADTPEAEIHALRKQVKKLRYLMEFFAPLHPRAEMAALMKPVRKVQSALGAFNDLAVQRERLEGVLATLDPGREEATAIASSIGAALGALSREGARAHDRAVGRLGALLAAREGFEALFAAKEETG